MLEKSQGLVEQHRQVRKKYTETLTAIAAHELREGLIAILKPHLKNRKVNFNDDMGSATLMIKRRSGERLFINDDGTWVPGNAYYNFHILNSFGWVEEVKSLLQQYLELEGGVLGIGDIDFNL